MKELAYASLGKIMLMDRPKPEITPAEMLSFASPKPPAVALICTS